MRRAPFILLLAAVIGAAACGGQDDDPNGAKELYAKINAAPGFQAWSRAPNYGTRMPSNTVHGRSVDVYVSKEVSAVLAGPKAITTWPVGSVIVKDGYCRCGNRDSIAVMEKRAD